MFATIYLTSKDFNMDKLMEVLKTREILCNVEPLQSVVKDTDDNFRVESGAKVTMFDVTYESIIGLWFALRYAIHIHCVWLDCVTYSGCICDCPKYIQYCEDTGRDRLLCSEYCDCEDH